MLLLHVAAGTAALLVGPLVLLGVRRSVLPYQGLVLVVTGSALALAWPSDLPAVVRLLLGAVAVGSCAAAVIGSERALRATYVALVAAVAFVSGPVWAGVLVVAVGSAAVHVVPVRAAVTPVG